MLDSFQRLKVIIIALSDFHLFIQVRHYDSCSDISHLIKIASAPDLPRPEMKQEALRLCVYGCYDRLIADENAKHLSLASQAFKQFKE